MAAALGATLHEMEWTGGRFRRYTVLALNTIALLLRSRPNVVFFQNPSLVLAGLVTGMKFLRLTRATVIGDFHNAGLFPPIGKFLIPWIIRRCDLVIVSNFELEAIVIEKGGRCISIPDPLPEMPNFGSEVRTPDGRFHVLMICSWAADEPVAEVLRAAEILQTAAPEILVSITGRPKLERIGWSKRVPHNVVLTGFLSEAEFEKKIKSSDVLMDLTTRPDCMVCGAYEGVSAEVPIIVSKNEPMFRYFNKGAVFTSNSSADIADKIIKAMTESKVLSRQVKELKFEILENEREFFKGFSEKVRQISE